MTPTEKDIARFWSYVDKSGDCWTWTACTLRRYGSFALGRSSVRAHRFSWLVHNGPIPDELIVMHLCDNPTCVNPSHLVLGTQAANMADMVLKGRRSPLVARSVPKEVVKKIRRDRLLGLTYPQLASRHGVCRHTASKIVRGKIHVD